MKLLGVSETELGPCYHINDKFIVSEENSLGILFS